MKQNYRNYQTLQSRQERRIRWQYGLTEAQARIIAPFVYGRACK